MGILRGMRREDAKRAAEEWLERLELGGRKNEKLDQLSIGNQQKVQFIAAILHRPKFAILDEPFSGLDPVNQEFYLDIIRELRASGMTVLLSAHQMDLVQRLADRVLLMNRGRCIFEGTLAEVRASSTAFKKVVLKLAGATGGIERFDMVDHFEARGEKEYAFALRSGASMSSFLAAELLVYKEPFWKSELEERLTEAKTQWKIQELQLPPTQLADALRPMTLTVRIHEGGHQPTSTAEKIAAGLVIGVMRIGIFIGAAYQFVAITGEKQLRVTEMFVSAVTPQ